MSWVLFDEDYIIGIQVFKTLSGKLQEIQYTP